MYTVHLHESLTRVTAREFRVRSPDGTWQFFLIRHDSILEIRANGMYIPCESIPARTVDLSNVPTVGAEVHGSSLEDWE